MNNSHDSSNDLLTVGPLVSVGIPTYNQPEGLRQTLKCITGQTYKNLEIIVSDDCSSGPETESVVHEFMAKDNRIQYYRQETNINAAFNCQFVLEKATGEYFMWAEDDDIISQDLIESCLYEFSLNNSLICVSNLVDRFESIETQKYLYSYDFYSNIGQNTYQRVKAISTIIVSGKPNIATMISGLFRREMIINIKFNSQFGGDLLFLLTASAKGEFTTIPKKLLKKYGRRKTINELKERFNYQFTGNPYWHFKKETIHIVDNMNELSDWQKFKIKIFFPFLYCNCCIVKPKLNFLIYHISYIIRSVVHKLKICINW